MYNSLWLNYSKVEQQTEEAKYIADVMKTVCVEGFATTDSILNNCLKEIRFAVKEMFQSEVLIATGTTGRALFLRRNQALFQAESNSDIASEGYHVYADASGYHIEAAASKGLLYGVFYFLGLLRQAKCSLQLDVKKCPDNPLRMLNHWDNMDGSIERGYSGNSFFFENEELIVNERTERYARLAASVGINAVVINNVNVKGAATDLISDRFYTKVNELANLFQSYGIRLFLSINYAMPMEKDLDTADPMNEDVCNWWKEKCREVYAAVPALGGFLVKADSEGRPGPFTYQRTQADGANMLARAIRPYGGLIIWRCFVYNCQQDWRDQKTDRARAGYDYFSSLDGQFEENVVLQIKNGPMDFQVREPVSPLFGGLKQTNQMLEVQIAQEYTGQQIHVCYLIPWFRQILAFQTYLKGDETDGTVADIISGRALKQKYCGMAAVANTGNDENWTGHDLAAANLYGFGRLAFDTSLTAEEIAEEWIRLTLAPALTAAEFERNHRQVIVDCILDILMKSWPAYEKYTSPLGIGWMVVPNTHFGPDVDGYEYSRWGTYHRADHLGIGVDRTESGTGYTKQYREPNASIYASVEACPEELLLFFHHMPYTYTLKTGKTIIQHIYDSHFEGAKTAEELLESWKGLEGKIPKKVYTRVQSRMEYQAKHAKEWRDVINSYFYRKSGIPDLHKREIF